MKTIVGIAGSWRRKSHNVALLHAARAVAPTSLLVEIGSIAGIPLYDADIEHSTGIPDVVQRLKERLIAADGLLVVTPEYNLGPPGVLKNAIDWLSRPPRDIVAVFGDKPVAMMGATPGRGGTREAQAALLVVLRSLGTRPWFGAPLHVSGASRAFDHGGALVDADVRRRLTEYMAGFADFLGK